MHIHILGIGGVFMTGIALLAKALGHRVEGSDMGIYSPTKEILAARKIKTYYDYKVEHLNRRPDLTLIGNVISRGNTMVEHILAHNIPFQSGPEWLAHEVLRDRWVLAVSGTHGKTTTTALLAWIMENAGHKPGFLIGGSPLDFEAPARLGEPPFFVIEADEYDTAFFDKRPKFMHYRPLTLAINNLEFDHADIFSSLDEIQKQFQYLLRMVPSTGRIITSADSKVIKTVLGNGYWSELEQFSVYAGKKRKRKKEAIPRWTGRLLSSDGSRYELSAPNGENRELNWRMMGTHNVCNALAAAACAQHVGIPLDDIVRGIESFAGVHRRMQLLGEVEGVCVYEDFAHHPTAIACTLEAMRAHVGARRLVAVLELRSNTMRSGIHCGALKDATSKADRILWYKPNSLKWSLEDAVSAANTSLHSSVDDMLKQLLQELQTGDHVVLMSNGDFDGMRYRLLEDLNKTRNTKLETPN